MLQGEKWTRTLRSRISPPDRHARKVQRFANVSSLPIAGQMGQMGQFTEILLRKPGFTAPIDVRCQQDLGQARLSGRGRLTFRLALPPARGPTSNWYSRPRSSPETPAGTVTNRKRICFGCPYLSGEVTPSIVG